ncbi:metallopeptidase TldD-related protein [Kineosporia babensis]|uniref:Metallopeptidase TldD-related protein n=1 Tax=Kineosporia babensis TaxID=499548 RepID=A0A9X1STU9_9ACTN|nr:metallopeptidase TldD-related protein [Kineosporia babensis]MCD5312279.1 metallopeptidase TldD-related protein [Kineosporia babensis]
MSAGFVEIALAEVKALGPDLGAAVLVSQSSTVNLRWALSGLTTNGLTSSRSVTVIVGAPVSGGTGAGVLSREGLDAEGVRALVRDTVALAREAEPAEDAAPFVTGEELPGFADPAAETGASTLAGVAEALGEVFGRSRAQQRESFGFALHEVVTTWLGTSGGLRYRHEQPRGTIELTGKAGARSRSAYLAGATRDFSDVDVLAMDDEIATRLRWQERQIEVKPGRYTTVLPPTSTADLMIYYLWSSDARTAHEGRSVFSRTGGGTRVGEQISSTPLSLLSDPHHFGLGCADRVLSTSSSPMASVFDNGLDAPSATWLERGTISALPTTRHTAGLTGLPVNPPADNLILTGEGGTGSTLDLLEGVSNGLLLSSMWYIREVDPQTLLLTGLTRDGVYVVENGEVVGATSNFRYNESPVDLLGRVEAYGASEICLSREWGEWFTRTAMPALRISDFNMSTVAEGS